MNQIPTKQGPRLDQTTEVVCDNCKNVTFAQGVLLRKISALVSPEGKEGYVPIPTFYCTSCGNVNQEFIPAELKNRIKLA